jgi:hypothetical protein
MTASVRIADRYLKKAGDTSWAIDQMGQVITQLQDVVDVLGNAPHALGNLSGETSKVVNDIKQINQKLHQDIQSLSKIKKLAAPTAKMDTKTRNKINSMLSNHGLDGNKSFEKAERGYAAALDVLGYFGVEMDQVVNSHMFSQKKDGHPQGSLTVDLAFSNKEDSFSPTPISNTMLVLSYYLKENDKFEVTAYLS